MFLNDNMTPYTSFASSSNGSPVEVNAWMFCCTALLGTTLWRSGLDCCGVFGALGESMSFTATTTPDEDDSVFLGLLNGVPAAVVAALEAAGLKVTARDTPGMMPPPGTAGLGRLVRCQSW